MLDADTLKYGYLAGKCGAAPILARPFLIGLRNFPVTDAPKYDDKFVLLTNEDLPVIFSGATHAYQLNSTESQDLNHDGVGDVACICPGSYILTDALSAPYPIFILTTPDGNGNVPAWRDTNHDGKFSDSELAVKTTANAVLFHTGWDAPPDSAHRSSIACQTTSLKWLQAMHAACQKAKGKIIDYCLINNDDAEKIMAEFVAP